MPSPTGYEIVPPDLLDGEYKTVFGENVKFVLDSCLESAHVHGKSHVFFFSVEAKTKSVTVDLCDLLSWCKYSSVVEADVDSIVERIEPGMKACAFRSPFLNGFVVVETLTNVGECNLFIGNCTHSLQMKLIHRKGSSGKTLVGVSVHTSKTCIECGAPSSESVKLRKCSRCFLNHQARVLYCSKECQRKDYPRHRSVCARPELMQDDWRSCGRMAYDYL